MRAAHTFRTMNTLRLAISLPASSDRTSSECNCRALTTALFVLYTLTFYVVSILIIILENIFILSKCTFLIQKYQHPDRLSFCIVKCTHTHTLALSDQQCAAHSSSFIVWNKHRSNDHYYHPVHQLDPRDVI